MLFSVNRNTTVRVRSPARCCVSCPIRHEPYTNTNVYCSWTCVTTDVCCFDFFAGLAGSSALVVSRSDTTSQIVYLNRYFRKHTGLCAQTAVVITLLSLLYYYIVFSFLFFRARTSIRKIMARSILSCLLYKQSVPQSMLYDDTSLLYYIYIVILTRVSRVVFAVRIK